MYNKISRSDRKFNKTREWLYEEYVIKNRPRKEIAAECNLTLAGLKNTLNKYGISKPKLEISISELKKYLEEGNSVDDICDIYHCTRSSVYKRMRENNLTIHYKPDFKKYDDTNDELICQLYLDGFSTIQIGTQLNMTHGAVLNHLEHCGLNRRTLSQSQWAHKQKNIPVEFRSYETMHDLYIVQKLSKKDLGKRFNCDPCVIDRVLQELKIPIRSNSESKVGLKTGEEHPNWQGGITPLHLRLREYFKVNQAPKALERDGYKCQICGKTGTLHVHHIKPFAQILKRIISEHPELDVEKSINELYNITIHDAEFCDINNLVSYCKECHYKVHGFNL